MWWLTVLVMAVILLGVWALRPMKIPREPGREGPQEGKAVEAYDRTSRWPVFVFERAIILHEITRDKPQGQLLDIGCGPGFLAAAMSRRFKNDLVTGLDINREMLEIARRRWPPSSYANLTFLPGDAQKMPVADKSIDYVVSSLSLHHWEDPGAVFREIVRILKPGGRLLIFDLKRDGPHYFYYALKIGQALAAPRAIRETNGAVGSFWAGYTAKEIENILSDVPLSRYEVDNRSLWLLIRGETRV